MKSIALITLLCLSLPLMAQQPQRDGATIGRWTQDFDAAKKLAKEKELPILINFTGSDWCGWCIHMDKQVFNTKAWRDYSRTNLVLAYIDFPRNKSLVPPKFVERNQELKSTHKVSGYPTYILLASDGETVLGRLGAAREITPEIFISRVKALIEKQKKDDTAKKE